MDSSQLTMMRNARALYHSFLSDSIRSQQGCNALPVYTSSGLMTRLGARFTNIDEYEIVDAASQCPAVGADLTSPFTPDEIASLRLWLDASDTASFASGSFPANNTIINTWRDKSASGNNATAPVDASGAKFIAANLNGLPGLAFNYDATPRILNAGNILNSDDFSIFAVGSYTSAAGLGSHLMLSSWKKEFPSQVAISENNLMVLPGLDTDSFVSSNRLAIPYTYQAGVGKLFEIVTRSNEMGTTLTGGVNGTVTTVSGEVQNTASDLGRGFTLGGTLEVAAGVMYKANVVINEVIVCGDDVGADIRQRIEGYLSHKWGLTLPAGHPWELNAP